MLSWGWILGITLACAQLASLPLLSIFSPLASVREAARVPSVIGAALQLINGVVFIGEGVMQGCGGFFPLALGNIVATLGMIASLQILARPDTLGLAGVWFSFTIFNSIRLAAAMLYYNRNGPLAPRNLDAADRELRETSS